MRSVSGRGLAGSFRGVLTASVAVLVLATMAGGAPARTVEDVLADVRAATARYVDIDRARADGYVQVSDMERDHGYHFVHPNAWAWAAAGSVLSPALDLARPPVLLYVRRAETWQLAGVEYMLPRRPADEPFPGARWHEHEASCHYRDYREIPRPSAAACPVRHPESGSEFVLFHPAMAVVHVWAWHPNPDGPFAPDNRYLAPYGGATAAPHADGAGHGRSGTEVAYSELNHRSSGAILLLIALAMFWEERRPRPLPWGALSCALWVALGIYLFVRSDPEAWPWGPKRFVEIFSDTEVLQHKVLTLLPVVIGIVSLLVKTGRLGRPAWRYALAPMALLGGAGLFVHVHDGAFHLDRIYLQHVLMGVTGVAFGLGALVVPSRGSIARYALPVIVLLLSFVLLLYSEA